MWILVGTILVVVFVSAVLFETFVNTIGNMNSTGTDDILYVNNADYNQQILMIA